jgi:hypothetical protein
MSFRTIERNLIRHHSPGIFYKISPRPSFEMTIQIDLLILISLSSPARTAEASNHTTVNLFTTNYSQPTTSCIRFCS